MIIGVRGGWDRKNEMMIDDYKWKRRMSPRCFYNDKQFQNKV
jgi:hypothetical protein